MANILIKLTYLFDAFQALSKNNPVFAGVASLYGLGILTFALRDVPTALWDFLTQQMTTTMTLNSHDDIFYTFLTWISKHKMHRLMRSYNLGNPNRWGVREEILTLGYGRTFLLFKGFPIFISRYKVEANATEYAKETIQLTILGRNSKRFYELLDEMKDSLKNTGDTFTVYAWRDHWWFQMAILPKRSLNTLSLPQKTRTALVRHIRAFISEKAWYLANGIPYRTGVLLQGPPGTGKTSLITAICSDFNKACYILDLAGHTDITLKEAVSKIPHGDILVIEDIDTHFGKRGDLDKPLAKDADKEKDEAKTSLTLGGILNALDGIACGTDRIVIATTNHPEKLDPALVREGRFDLKLDIGFMTDETLHDYMGRLYPDFPKEEIKKWVVKPGIPPCKVQQLVFENRQEPTNVLSLIADRQEQRVSNDIDVEYEQRLAS
jgi:chaperone BCS1